MSNGERHKWGMRLVEQKLLAADLESELVRMRDLLRDHLDPHKPLGEIPLDIVAGVAVAAEALWQRYRQVLVDINNLKASLGER